MSRLLRIISLDSCLDDVRMLRACLAAQRQWRVSLHHLADVDGVPARLAKMRADVLFIDEDLPRVTGVETISALRSMGVTPSPNPDPPNLRESSRRMSRKGFLDEEASQSRTDRCPAASGGC